MSIRITAIRYSLKEDNDNVEIVSAENGELIYKGEAKNMPLKFGLLEVLEFKKLEDRFWIKAGSTPQWEKYKQAEKEEEEEWERCKQAAEEEDGGFKLF